MKLSVHILTYNSERFIKDALDSVLKQKTTFPFEIVIGDDASSDNTFNILESYAAKHTFIKPQRNKQNLGILKNFKATLDRCSGEYVFDLAGDDWIHDQTALQQMIDVLDKNKSLAFIDSGYDVFFEYKKKTKEFSNNKILNPTTYKAHVQTIGSPTLGCCFRKKALDKFVDFDHYIDLGFKIEDYPILADLTENCPFDFINKSFVTYRIHTTSYSSTSHDFLKLKLFFADKYNYHKEAIAKIYENYFNTKLVHASLHFKPEDGKEAFKKLVNKKFVHYVLYYSSKHRIIHKLLWVLRRLPI